MTPYQAEIANIARHIVDHPAGKDGNIDAFTASTVISIAHCKDKVEVIQDIINASKNEREWRSMGGE